MFEVCLEYKNATRYFHQVKSVKVINNHIYLKTDYGLLGELDLSDVENINIYPSNEDNNDG